MYRNYIKFLLLLFVAGAVFSAVASDEYSKTVKTVKDWISVKHGSNQKICAIMLKRVEAVTNSSASDSEKVAELKAKFASAFAVTEKTLEEVVNDLFRRAHLNNDAEAQYMLGHCCYFGIGTKQDFAQAAKWLNKAADNGNSNARYLLGICRYFGQGVEKDQHKAIEHFKHSADNGHHGAQLVMAICYHEGIDVEKEYFKCFEYLGKAVESNCMVAQRILANCYYFGDGVKKDASAAVKWYSKAVEKGDPEARWRLGVCYHNGYGCTKNYRKGAELLAKSAKQGDNVAQNAMSGRRFFQFGAVKDSTKAILHSVADEKAQFNKDLEFLRKH